jgi:hypothetical protein
MRFIEFWERCVVVPKGLPGKRKPEEACNRPKRNPGRKSRSYRSNGHSISGRGKAATRRPLRLRDFSLVFARDILGEGVVDWENSERSRADEEQQEKEDRPARDPWDEERERA